MDDSSGSKNLSTKDSEIQISGLPAGKTFKFKVIASVGQVNSRLSILETATLVIQHQNCFQDHLLNTNPLRHHVE